MKAADNYSTLYALAEADTSFTEKQIILADGQDEETLPKAMGPFQIIATGEKKHARMIHSVVSITIAKP